MKFAPPISHTITSVTNRKENHGPDLVLAATMKFTVKGTSEQIVDPFSSTLRKSLFNNEEGMEHLGKFAELTKFNWGLEYKDSVLVIGPPDKPEHRLEGVTLKDFDFQIADGGVIELAYAASFPVDEEELGPLAALIKETRMVSFATPIDMVQQQQHEPAEA